ncbi:hypothetical protein EH243_16090 [Amphritea opalescens]|uniref:Uncharacterized protein n=1 Tax=Amphritea opalescens TaxID=2490544 RepID=A0A430KME1_9GAMM|nr:hypothetical protein [Amphritea opalescens]RTE64624.1 hypothetical protein EH243_16090 [Amphritea opalescens]
MVIWTTSEIYVFIAVIGMIVFKLWSVWHVSLQAKANREGRVIFLGLLSDLTLFGLTAKIYISHVLS